MKASYKVRKSCYQADGLEWVCEFKIDGKLYQGYHGTGGTGLNLYRSVIDAVSAGQRYLRNMAKQGYET